MFNNCEYILVVNQLVFIRRQFYCMLCPEYFLWSTCVLIIFADILLYVAIYRVQSSFAPKKKIFLYLSVGCMMVTGIVLGFQMYSTCARIFLTWGSITFAFHFCWSVVEVCAAAFIVQ